jgi:DNA-binding MarR family transcriptional regulator
MHQRSLCINLMRLYLATRRFTLFCKKLDSKRVVRHLIMLSISENPKTIKELADEFSVKHSWMSTILGKMESDKLIEKYVHCDPRCRIVKLTPKGEAILGRILAVMDRHTQEAFADMSSSEVETMANLFEKVKTDYNIHGWEEVRRLNGH